VGDVDPRSPPNASLFAVPANYRRTDTQEAPKAARETLTFELPAK
jgi:hypothetical protein